MLTLISAAIYRQVENLLVRVPLFNANGATCLASFRTIVHHRAVVLCDASVLLACRGYGVNYFRKIYFFLVRR